MENYNRIKEDKYGIYYYLDDKLHRLDGPAIDYNNGDKLWFKNGELHRIGGPAVKNVNGDEEWYINGLPHRTDGPACEFSNGKKEWWFEGIWIECNSQEEFERYIKLKLFW